MAVDCRSAQNKIVATQRSVKELSKKCTVCVQERNASRGVHAMHCKQASTIFARL